ncbi:hypothetical protein QE152_g37470 [Popillia japonica]|uniref:HTH CENPB-type domain-containing protein n=1 Tax=Popillia japonica TaxID=7064 RepID=A0AAW1IA96_POPJA
MFLAQDYAKANNKKTDPSWENNKSAGKQWLSEFRKRHSDKLSLRKPQAISLARSTAINKETVAKVLETIRNFCNPTTLLPMKSGTAMKLVLVPFMDLQKFWQLRGNR